MFVSRNTAVPTAAICPPEGSASVDRALRRLSPVLARAASETAEAFFPGHDCRGPDREATALSGSGTLRCSQANIGGRYEMVCGLAVDRNAWAGLLSDSAGEDLAADVLGELVNCICGSVLSDPGFLEEFGQLLPCAPSRDNAPQAFDVRRLEGAVRVSGTWIRFTFSIKECNEDFYGSGRVVEAA